MLCKTTTTKKHVMYAIIMENMMNGHLALKMVLEKRSGAQKQIKIYLLGTMNVRPMEKPTNITICQKNFPTKICCVLLIVQNTQLTTSAHLKKTGTKRRDLGSTSIIIPLLFIRTMCLEGTQIHLI